ncbi:hypothetical protein NAT51_17845 [Flavobacterium amniphilum]|uniref:hypothetical protein n=1 Tax=Flavobacterium amniphilum TaxID=1834035 RepID=UPI00202A4637|nr:hypothetical protein [Flavobacterium amniphilum]MCL9807395.1 hypothetical protein [Flavobacterium amniphilum]
MKKQSGNVLAFAKASITELNEILLSEINGGSTINGGIDCSGCCCDPLVDAMKPKNILQ